MEGKSRPRFHRREAIDLEYQLQELQQKHNSLSQIKTNLKQKKQFIIKQLDSTQRNNTNIVNKLKQRIGQLQTQIQTERQTNPIKRRADMAYSNSTKHLNSIKQDIRATVIDLRATARQRLKRNEQALDQKLAESLAQARGKIEEENKSYEDEVYRLSNNNLVKELGTMNGRIDVIERENDVRLSQNVRLKNRIKQLEALIEAKILHRDEQKQMLQARRGVMVRQHSFSTRDTDTSITSPLVDTLKMQISDNYRSLQQLLQQDQQYSSKFNKYTQILDDCIQELERSQSVDPSKFTKKQRTELIEKLIPRIGIRKSEQRLRTRSESKRGPSEKR